MIIEARRPAYRAAREGILTRAHKWTGRESSPSQPPLVFPSHSATVFVADARWVRHLRRYDRPPIREMFSTRI